ncbi:hypothetical protein BD779DRAFT_562934 [Infundibulicybe gibba]|nr:hypothetical protein BD779DRAFT_562934 [Infundibulicybe gibba]
MHPLCFAYYCSGHGYGHATRVSAFACHLLSLPESLRPIVHIVSSAPKHVFAQSIAEGASYRYAEIDPVIVQPLAYRVDRQKSVEVLKSFLARKESILDTEREWLVKTGVQCVLSDAAFLGCSAAKAANIPSILITNFTFDSVYSYLSTPLLDTSLSPQPDQLRPTDSPPFVSLVPDVPVSRSELQPLVDVIHAGYRCADLLLLLPGNIPIPAFSKRPSLPSPDWVDVLLNRFYPKVRESLTRPPTVDELHGHLANKSIPRSVVSAPLLVRPPTASIYSPEGRAQLLSSIDIPPHLHSSKILIVSFGGQIIRAPSRSGSRSPSRRSSCTDANAEDPRGLGIVNAKVQPPSGELGRSTQSPPQSPCGLVESSPRIATPSHLWIPGAPPASKPSGMPTSPTAFTLSTPQIPTFSTVPPTPNHTSDLAFFEPADVESDLPQLLPDSSWIAVVCGVSKEEWGAQGEEDLPDNFFVAPRDIYMPDLTAVGDVLLGKLGYGTVSECVDACTPFVYVSRPLFIEEHGLRLLLDTKGVGVELPRQSYEAGDWAIAVELAWAQGGCAKEKKRVDMACGIGADKIRNEGRKIAETVINWTRVWWDVEAGCRDC